jgi:hypothetical protein
MAEGHIEPAVLALIPEVFAPWDEYLNLGIDEDFDDLEDLGEVEELNF